MTPSLVNDEELPSDESDDEPEFVPPAEDAMLDDDESAEVLISLKNSTPSLSESSAEEKPSVPLEEPLAKRPTTSDDPVKMPAVSPLQAKPAEKRASVPLENKPPAKKPRTSDETKKMQPTKRAGVSLEDKPPTKKPRTSDETKKTQPTKRAGVSLEDKPPAKKSHRPKSTDTPSIPAKKKTQPPGKTAKEASKSAPSASGKKKRSTSSNKKKIQPPQTSVAMSSSELVSWSDLFLATLMLTPLSYGSTR